MTDHSDSQGHNSDNSRTRRRFLTAATSAVGLGGVAGVAVPFLGSWSPSEKAKAAGAPVRADISKLEPGQMVVIEWRGKPVYVLRRTPEQVAGLVQLNDDLKDPLSESSSQPDYIAGEARALNEEYLVLVGLCTHLGGDEWLGGFFCPCHGSKFDLAGRVYKGVPASANLEIPPYSFESDNVLVIGVDAEVA